MIWFGTAWPSPERPAEICKDPTERVPTPVGGSCLYCSELIDEQDNGVVMPYLGMDGSGTAPVHIECQLRAVFGCVAHLEHRCSCFGGTDHDTAGLTMREEARLVQLWIYENGVIS